MDAVTADVLAILPLAIPLVTAAVSLLLARNPVAQRATVSVGQLALLAAAFTLVKEVDAHGMLISRLGGWSAPYGIVVVADRFGAGMVLAGALLSSAVVFTGLGRERADRVQAHQWPLVHMLLMGVNGAFLTGDLFNMYVWFEVLLTASFVLLVLGNERIQVVACAKYAIINLLSSASFLLSAALLYGLTGTLNMADLHQVLTEEPLTPLHHGVMATLVFGFGLKAAAFPLSFWLPVSYPAPPAEISALFAGLLTKVGVVALVRTSTLLFSGSEVLPDLLMFLAGASLVVGALGALAQRRLRQALSFLLMTTVGFALLGAAVRTEASLTAMSFYLWTDVLVVGTLFLLAGAVESETGTDDMLRMGGLYPKYGAWVAAYGVTAFSLAGFPPTPGFWGKLGLLKGAFDAGWPGLVWLGLGVSLLVLMAVGQILAWVFFRPRAAVDSNEGRAAKQGETPAPRPVWALLLAALLIGVGCFPGPLYDLAAASGAQLAQPERVAEAVLER